MTPPSFIDTHCHLEESDFRTPAGEDERPQVMARAAAAGVSRLIVIGSGKGAAEVDGAVALSRAHGHIWASIGVHPHDAKAIAGVPADAPETGTETETRAATGPIGEALWQHIEAIARSEPRVVAIGETGLDYHYDLSPRPLQAALMRRFVDLAVALGKPVSLHIRDGKEPHEAHREAQQIVRDAGCARGVVHCFTGDAEDAAAWLALGFHISLSGIVTFKSAAAIQEAARLVPAGRLLLETDCPFLAPIPLRGKRNEPAYLVHTAERVAQLRGVPIAQLAAETTAAAEALFKIAPVQ